MKGGVIGRIKSPTNFHVCLWSPCLQLLWWKPRAIWHETERALFKPSRERKQNQQIYDSSHALDFSPSSSCARVYLPKWPPCFIKLLLTAGERHLEAREVPTAVLAGRGREERRCVAADQKSRRARNPLWQVCQASLSARAGGEVTQVNVFTQRSHNLLKHSLQLNSLNMLFRLHDKKAWVTFGGHKMICVIVWHTCHCPLFEWIMNLNWKGKDVTRISASKTACFFRGDVDSVTGCRNLRRQKRVPNVFVAHFFDIDD